MGNLTKWSSEISKATDVNELSNALDAIEKRGDLDNMSPGFFAGFTYFVLRRLIYLLVRNSITRH